MSIPSLSWSRSSTFTPNQIQGWKRLPGEHAEDVFGGDAVKAKHNEQEIEKLHAKIGQLSMENDFFSKVLGRDR